MSLFVKDHMNAKKKWVVYKLPIQDDNVILLLFCPNVMIYMYQYNIYQPDLHVCFLKKSGSKDDVEIKLIFFEILEDFQYKSSICNEKVARFDWEQKMIKWAWLMNVMNVSIPPCTPSCWIIIFKVWLKFLFYYSILFGDVCCTKLISSLSLQNKVEGLFFPCGLYWKIFLHD